MQYQELSKEDRIETYTSSLLKKNEKEERKKLYGYEAYYYNEIKEDITLKYVEDFNIQYKNLYPSKPKLLLSPHNEFGQRKFISSFIKPTLLPYDELYDVKKCSNFISDHITYEVFDCPKDELQDRYIPNSIVSPTMTLDTQKGDSFDISILLASILLGGGYNAYVCYGTAHKDVANRITRKTTFDLENIEYFKKKEKKKEEKKQINSKYVVKKRPLLKSKFLEKLKAEINNPKKEKNDLNLEKKKAESKDIKYKKKDSKVHCWIIVLPGKRDVEEPIFIEPSTGEIKSINDRHYFEIISLFNHTNYWVNMQTLQTFNTTIDEQYFDLSDNRNWEFIFFSESDLQDQQEPTKSESVMIGSTSTFPTSSKNSSQDIMEEIEKSEILDCPLSWVNNLSISKEKYVTRFPLKSKLNEYKNVSIRRSCPFFEKDLSVCKVTIFRKHKPKKKQKIPKMIKEEHYFYQKRKDKLEQHSQFYSYDKKDDDGTSRVLEEKLEKFGKGRKISSTELEGLKEIRKTRSKEVYKFYHKARLDGLKKIEKIYLKKKKNVQGVKSGKRTKFKKIKFFFKGRDDKLVYRSANLKNQPTDVIDEDDKAIAKGRARGRGDGNGSNIDQKGMYSKKTEKYCSVSNHPEEEVAKIVMIPNKMYKVFYHFGKDKITRSTKELNLENMNFEGNKVLKFSKKPRLEDAIKDFNDLNIKNKKCNDEISRCLADLNLIIERRKEEKKNIKFETNVYDTLMNQPSDDELEEMRKQELLKDSGNKDGSFKEHDILAGYIKDKEGIKDKKMAQSIFVEVLERTKNRILQRTKIMENRLREEKALMNKKRIQYQKQDSEPEKETEFIAFWEKTMFRIEILKKRMQLNHKESKQEYEEMQIALLNDPRLSKFLTDEREKVFSRLS